MKEYIHYGSTEFSKYRFREIRNQAMWTKPYGGLWASPIDTQYGWKDWCESNEFRICDENNSFKFTLDEQANVYHIYSVKDLDPLPKIEPGSDYVKEIVNHCAWIVIDFENMVESGIDAIEFHLSEETDITDYRLSLYNKLYDWDCDSILIMNPKVVKLIT